MWSEEIKGQKRSTGDKRNPFPRYIIYHWIQLFLTFDISFVLPKECVDKFVYSSKRVVYLCFLLSYRLLTYSYLAAFNFWLLLFPFTLSHDWQMGSIPLVTNLFDYRNLFTCVFFIFCCWTLYRILTDFEVSIP